MANKKGKNCRNGPVILNVDCAQDASKRLAWNKNWLHSLPQVFNFIAGNASRGRLISTQPAAVQEKPVPSVHATMTRTTFQRTTKIRLRGLKICFGFCRHQGSHSPGQSKFPDISLIGGNPAGMKMSSCRGANQGAYQCRSQATIKDRKGARRWGSCRRSNDNNDGGRMSQKGHSAFSFAA